MQPYALWPSHASGKPAGVIDNSPTCQHKSLAMFLTRGHSLDPDPTQEGNSSHKKMLGGALVLMFIEMVTGICLVFSHVLAIVTEQYTSGYPCSIRHCSTKGCGNVDISGSPGPKLGHGTDRRYGHWVRVQLNLRLSALLKSTLLYIAEGFCFNVQRKVRERDLATGDYLLCINYLLMQNTRHQS